MLIHLSYEPKFDQLHLPTWVCSVIPDWDAELITGNL